jgi:outer membrane receptor protein involved in Fe transport
LPGAWQNFGVVANYTYVDSERTTADGDKAPMPGTSEHSANGVFYFSTGTIDTRIIYNYRDTYLRNQDDQEYVDASGRLDFAFRYTFFEDWVASLDVSNITEETEYVFNDQIKSRFQKRQLEGRRILIGLSYSF